MTTCVLVSGGIDSYTAYRLYEQNFLCDNKEDKVYLFVNCNQPYARKELDVVSKLVPSVRVIKAPLVNEWINTHVTPHNQEIVGRNSLAIFYGSLMANNVVLSSLSTETYPGAVIDKQPEYLDKLQDVLSINANKNVHILRPFSTLTKSQLVCLGLSKGITKEDYRKTVSCYDEVSTHCGKCSTCFKRWVAMINNDIEEDYAFNPWKNEYARGIILGLKNYTPTPRISLQRYLEMKTALEKVGINV